MKKFFSESLSKLQWQYLSIFCLVLSDSTVAVLRFLWISICKTFCIRLDLFWFCDSIKLGFLGSSSLEVTLGSDASKGKEKQECNRSLSNSMRTVDQVWPFRIVLCLRKETGSYGPASTSHWTQDDPMKKDDYGASELFQLKEIPRERLRFESSSSTMNSKSIHRSKCKT